MNGLGAVLNLQARARRNALAATHVLARRRRQQDDAATALRDARADADGSTAAPAGPSRD